MIFDSTNKFSTDQAIVATAASTNVIDLGVTGRNIGIGESVPVYIEVTEDFNNLTSLQVTLQTDDSEDFSGAVNVIQTAPILLASLVSGYVFNLNILTAGIEGRYMRLNYTVAGTAPTTGQITAGVTAGNQANV